MGKKKKGKQAGLSGHAYIKGGKVIIEVRIKDIPAIYQDAVDAGYRNPGFKIGDAKAFAKDWVSYGLNDEAEDGNTPIYQFLDETMDAAIDQAAQGVEEAAEEEE